MWLSIVQGTFTDKKSHYYKAMYATHIKSVTPFIFKKHPTNQ